MNLVEYIDQIADFPSQGILYYDISTLIGNATAWSETVSRLCTIIQPHNPDLVFGIESRGFLVAASLGLRLNIGMQMIRKKGKLPGPTVSHTYELEYGSDILEVQKKVSVKGQRVVIVDDVLATGGTLAAATTLVRQIGAQVACSACIIELSFLEGRKQLNAPFHSLVTF
ncbi:MAG: adenine phosphoribosyltransferase [Rhodospirillaceae bacterium]|nr:adenine phosphoribosyltransferase [Rhodospirillaceae bacterium]